MKCPNCKTEMEKGGLLNNGNNWVSGLRASFQRLTVMQGEKVYAYRCPKCGKVELTTKVK